jgi:hypothetical protein
MRPQFAEPLVERLGERFRARPLSREALGLL